MVNRRAKGNKIALACKKRLESEGWLVDSCDKKQRFCNGPRDLFGLFDLAAIRAGKMLLVQCTSEVPHTHRHYQLFVDTYGPLADIFVEQWVWRNRVGFKVYRYEHGKERGVREL